MAGGRWPARRWLAGVRYPVEGGVASGQRGGVSVQRYDHHNWDDEDDDKKLPNCDYCGLSACALVLENEHYYNGSGIDALVIGRSRT